MTQYYYIDVETLNSYQEGSSQIQNLRTVKILKTEWEQIQSNAYKNRLITLYDEGSGRFINVAPPKLEYGYYYHDYKYVDGAWKLNSSRSINDIKQDALRAINAITDTVFNDHLLKDYSTNEVSTFTLQLNQALLYKQGADKSLITFITTLAKNRGVKLDDLVAKILFKSKFYELITATVLGYKQQAEDLILSDENVSSTDLFKQRVDNYIAKLKELNNDIILRNLLDDEHKTLDKQQILEHKDIPDYVKKLWSLKLKPFDLSQEKLY